MLHMKRKIVLWMLLVASLVCFAGYAAGEEILEKAPLRVLIISKFEIEKITGDFPGEAQLFYERYCAGHNEIAIPHMPPSGHFYFNQENGTGILMTGVGKMAATLSLMALLVSGNYDYSDTYIVSVGCAGGSISKCALGDVIVVTAACDYDLGHHVDTHEREKSDSRIMWFPEDSHGEYEFKILNANLCNKVYEMIRDCPLRTTEQAKSFLAKHYPDYWEGEQLPSVRKGTAVTGDNYWKGLYGHETADFIAEYYGCPDPYTVTEMEEIAIANTADCFGLLDRMISLRVVVNTDLFMPGETPENTWGEVASFSEKVQTTNNETLDIFEPAMYNLFDTAAIVIDAILAGEFWPNG